SASASAVASSRQRTRTSPGARSWSRALRIGGAVKSWLAGAATGPPVRKSPTSPVASTTRRRTRNKVGLFHGVDDAHDGHRVARGGYRAPDEKRGDRVDVGEEKCAGSPGV